jgi:hypothetical protein
MSLKMQHSFIKELGELLKIWTVRLGLNLRKCILGLMIR